MSMCRELQNFSDDLISLTPCSLSVLDLPLDSLCTPVLGTAKGCKAENPLRRAASITITPQSSISDFSDVSLYEDDSTTIEQGQLSPPHTPCPLAMDLCLDGKERPASHRFLDVHHVHEVSSLIVNTSIDVTVVQLASRLMDRFRTVDIISDVRACFVDGMSASSFESVDYLSEILFVVCLHLSHKFLDDLPHTITFWLEYSGLYGLSTEQFVAVEQIVLSVIGYNLFSIWRNDCLEKEEINPPFSCQL